MVVELDVRPTVQKSLLEIAKVLTEAVSVCLDFFFFSSRRRHTRCSRDWSSDVCSSDLSFTISKGCGPAPQAIPYPGAEALWGWSTPFADRPRSALVALAAFPQRFWQSNALPFRPPLRKSRASRSRLPTAWDLSPVPVPNTNEPWRR